MAPAGGTTEQKSRTLGQRNIRREPFADDRPKTADLQIGQRRAEAQQFGP